MQLEIVFFCNLNGRWLWPSFGVLSCLLRVREMLIHPFLNSHNNSLSNVTTVPRFSKDR